MSLDLSDLMGIIQDFNSLQLDQIQSLADGDSDPDQYNSNHLKTIIKTLEAHNNAPFDFDDVIAFAQEMIE
jgi:hypothetical protein